eukprot:756455_1
MMMSRSRRACFRKLTQHAQRYRGIGCSRLPGGPLSSPTHKVFRCFSSDSCPHIIKDDKRVEACLSAPLSQVRNFSIIAHIDHGKSTLADRLLALAGNIDSESVTISGENAQSLDTLDVERERGITVKAQTASMFYESSDGRDYLLNLIDTPGHVDFSYEVSRSLSACQGALLLIDASQGVEAQTIATFELAIMYDVHVIPVLTKIDLPHARPEEVTAELCTMFDIPESSVLATSAKTGEGIREIFDALVERVPPPGGEVKGTPTRALVVDSWYMSHRGVNCLIQVRDGELRKGDRISSLKSDLTHEIQEIGILTPQPRSTDILRTGQVGYMIANMKTTQEVVLGDTVYHVSQSTKDIIPLEGFTESQPMVYASLYPADPTECEVMQTAIDKLLLNDPSVTVSKESSTALGLGFRCGFLGVLHMEVFRQRLEGIFGGDILVTAPTVPFRAIMADGSIKEITSPASFPEDRRTVTEFQQPIINATILIPEKYVGGVLNLCREYQGEHKNTNYLDGGRVMIKYTFSLRRIVEDFYSRLKSVTQGYASFDYEQCGYETRDLVRVDTRINSRVVDALSAICERPDADKIGRKLAARLKDVIKRQQFEVVIQAVVFNKVIARARIPPYRKDVLKQHGKTMGTGDRTRKMKLLAQQKAGKKRLKQIGNVVIPQEAFMAVPKY